MNSLDVRTQLVETLCLDLVGPGNDHSFARELLRERPSVWYQAGFLVPTGASAMVKEDPRALDELTPVNDEEPQGGEGGGTDAASGTRRSLFPSSMGISVFVPEGATHIEARIEWGDYQPEQQSGAGALATQAPNWRRMPRSASVVIPMASNAQSHDTSVPGSNGLVLTTAIRSNVGRLPAGTRALSVFLVNRRAPASDPDLADAASIFQARIELVCEAGFVPRGDPRTISAGSDWEDRVAELHYRDVLEYAVGHGVATGATVELEASRPWCRRVHTVWMPAATVERVEPAAVPGVELGMDALAAAAGTEALQRGLGPLTAGYRQWLAERRRAARALPVHQQDQANELIAEAERAARRIDGGIASLADEQVREAFQMANRAVAGAMRQRLGIDKPAWRPFQLAFILQALQGLAQPEHEDRERVDLLFFPTGGGKTEAYLGLAATAIVLRRLRSRDASGKPTVMGCGVSVLMRYTLRLLTLDQLGRAAGLVCALELERQAAPERYGDWPFEIGLWVGSGATPNNMGGPGDKSPGRQFTAYARWMAFRNGTGPAPIPLNECPWCGTPFKPDSFDLVPNRKSPQDMRIHCVNHHCAFTGDSRLPIVAVDEPLYTRLPAFLIATVDKFASLPWNGRTGALFGKVDSYDREGFYGPCDGGKGRRLPGVGGLLPPDLVIQDELHLISGPLGTIAGLYEAAFESLCTRRTEGGTIKPKIIASTATVRRADQQIRALFGRTAVDVFPPPGTERNDTFFARTVPDAEAPGRLYLGIAAQGRSLKVLMMRTAQALLSAAQRAWEGFAGDPKANPADPYMTLLGYFNALRELGGSRRIYEDEVTSNLSRYATRRRVEPVEDLFANRVIHYDILELTSRVGTDKVAEVKRRLARHFSDKEHVDVALATNMVSVGVDISRLGLMLVLGQPKTSAEYIQATSRVGRRADAPGLVVTLMNIHRPRDRSHYERFGAYHSTFYRSVEAGSVTPFASRALDRALAGSLLTLVRHGWPGLTAPRDAQQLPRFRTEVATAVEHLAQRAAAWRQDLSAEEADALAAALRNRCNELLDDWLNIAEEARQENSSIQYAREVVSPSRRLLHDVLEPGLGPRERRFRAGRSMRDVEPPVSIGIETLRN